VKKLLIAGLTLLLSSCISFGFSYTSSTSTASATSISSTTSVDPNLVLEVGQRDTDFTTIPMVATLDVKVSGTVGSIAQLQQGAWLIANGFYEDFVDEIDVNRLDLTIKLYGSAQAYTDTPAYGTATFVINETSDALGIQLATSEIVLP